MFDIKSPATFLEYFSFLQDAYLLEFVPIFNHSLKVQARNPKKVYIMDMGLYTENSISISDNMGRRLENLIFLHLRRKYKHIFYYKDKGECDFINFDREFNGLLGAMQNLGLKEGYIVTLNQSDLFEKEDMTIKMLPVHDFFEIIVL